MPAGIWLGKFGTIVADYFGHTAYHVGSSLRSKEWRDVDVRLILPDDEYAARFGSVHASYIDPRLAAITLAFSALGAAMTGLPVDFQIQTESHANGRYGDQMRSALVEVSFAPQPPTEETADGPRRVDPPGCGCTDCITGYSVPEADADRYRWGHT